MWLKHIRAGVATAMRFQAAGPIRRRPENTLETGRTLRETIFEHRLSKRWIYTLEIGANELLKTGGQLTFLQKFWTGDARFLSQVDTDEEPEAGDFVQVTIEGGTAPLEWLEEKLPYYSLTLVEKYANASTSL